MSYLDIPRISFNGTFSTNPSTINNFPSNYYAFVEPDNFKNKPPTAFRNPANFPPGVPANGPSWNATGLAQFSFSGTVRGYVNANGQAINTGDSLIGATVTTIPDPQSLFAGSQAKIVDLDPDQQVLTQLFGVVVQMIVHLDSGDVEAFTARISDASQEQNRLPVLNAFPPAPFCVWQWVMDDIQWNQDSSLPQPVIDLQDACNSGISIKVNVGSYSQSSHEGVISGTLGPAQAEEPFSFVAGRRLTSPNQQLGNFVIHKDRQVLTLDLGNSLPLNPDGTPVSQVAPQQAGYSIDGDFKPLENGQDLQLDDAFLHHAGIIDLPLDVSQGELQHLQNGPLLLMQSNGKTLEPVLSETQEGWFIKPELSSARLAADSAPLEIKFWVMKRGEPVSTEEFEVQLDVSPASGLTISALPCTQSGIQIFQVTAAALQTTQLPEERQWIGSQLFVISGSWNNADHGLPFGQGQQGFSILLWSVDAPPADAANPTWDEVKNRLGGYASLYPGMNRILQIGDQSIVDMPANAQSMHARMSAPVYDPGYMPVTRDLSPARRQLILSYLQNISAQPSA